MSDELKTEEFKRKKNYKIFIFIFSILIIISIFIFGIYSLLGYIKEKKSNKKEVIINPLNEELQDIYSFAISNNYIVALKKDKTYIKIYNLLQGTGNYGDFTSYFYNNKKLYLLYSDNILYTISLDKGNRLYELTKLSSIDNVSCLNGTIGKTDTISFNNNLIYINNSNCGITRQKIDSKNNKITSELLKNFTNQNTDVIYDKNSKSLYIYGDNNILKIDNNTKEISTLANNIIMNEKMIVRSNYLIYSDTKNNIKSYYGYNTKTNTTSKIVDANSLVVYNKSFIYMKDNKIYLLNQNKEKEIYVPHYNVLSDMVLINENILQVVDKDNEEEKTRIVNINLKSNKYEITYNKDIFTNVTKYQK